MTGFDSFAVVDWSAAAKLSPKRPSKDAIWMAIVRQGGQPEITYCRGRQEAEQHLCEMIAQEQAAGRRLLLGFDFPFGYPRGFARKVTGSDDPLILWDWLADRITDTADNANNRFDVAEEINAKFEGLGPLWGKTHKDRWPGVPYTKAGVAFDAVAEKRRCDRVAKAASSCFQLCYNPTVGSQILMGLPMLSRLRRLDHVAVWPFERVDLAKTVLVEIWPGLIEKAVRAAADGGHVRDAQQVTLLAQALSRAAPGTLNNWMDDIPEVAREEAWILGAGQGDELVSLAQNAQTVPPLKNDCFALPPGVHWTPVEDALAMLKSRLHPVTAIENRPVAAATRAVLAEPVHALRSSPPLPNTAVDGYGFAGGRPEGLHRLPLAKERAAAGDAPGTLAAGHAMRVLTGAALPDGVDTVVLQEDVLLADGAISFHGPIKQGANTRKAGEDVTAGAVALPRGRRVGPTEAALMASVGVTEVAVHRPLRVAVLSTGAELVEAGQRANPGQIFDANRPMLAEFVQRLGHVLVDGGRVDDNRDALRTALNTAADQADVILTSGGASAGDEDHVSALLSEAKALSLWRIAVKPGRPLVLGMWSDTPVFGLPGNPVAAMVCALVFAGPAMARLSGQDWPTPQGFDVPAAFSKNKKHGRSEYLRARIRDGRAEVFASEGSGRISGLAWAEGLVALPFEAQTITPGTPVRYIPFGSFGL